MRNAFRRAGANLTGIVRRIAGRGRNRGAGNAAAATVSGS